MKFHFYFLDLLIKNGNISFTGKISAKSLTTNSIHVDTINNIPLDDIYLENKPELINGLKTFKNLKAKQATIEILNGVKYILAKY